jgi:hypothetical protein
VGFESTIPVFGRAKTFHALDRAATVFGLWYDSEWRIGKGSCPAQEYTPKIAWRNWKTLEEKSRVTIVEPLPTLQPRLDCVVRCWCGILSGEVTSWSIYSRYLIIHWPPRSSHLSAGMFMLSRGWTELDTNNILPCGGGDVPHGTGHPGLLSSSLLFYIFFFLAGAWVIMKGHLVDSCPDICNTCLRCWSQTLARSSFRRFER